MTAKEPPAVALVRLHAGYDLELSRLQSRREVGDRLGRIVHAGGVKSGIFAIERDGAFVGIVGLVRSGALEGKDVELVCALLEEHEGCGIATASCRQLLLDEALAGTRSRVLASIAPDNSDGKELAQRLGFTRIGTRALSPDELWELALSTFVAHAV